ncbi:MAG: after-VIT domain-containing protein, partial [Leptolyngbyaceae bacterium]|nr:after-VIT domain-containing protein [Leptolyngbyaceae bacterium]
FRQINNPVLTHIQLQWLGDGEPPIFYPDRPNDLYAEQPLVVFGRKEDARPGVLLITGTVAGNQSFQQAFNLTFDESLASGSNPAVAQLWGRARIKSLMNQMVSGETKQGVEAVTETALSYKLLSQYTAFVAVSDDVRVNPKVGSVSVQVPVEMPEGVSHAGVFRTMTPPVIPQAMPIPYRLLVPKDSLPAPRSVCRPPSPCSPDRALESLCSSAPMPRHALEAHSRLSIASVTGLDQSMIVSLLRHLQSVSVSEDIAGDLVFEFHIQKGRVKQVVLDEQETSIIQLWVIDNVRRSLLTWKPGRSLQASVRLVIRIAKSK